MRITPDHDRWTALLVSTLLGFAIGGIAVSWWVH
jgi:hypothetical protein